MHKLADLFDVYAVNLFGLAVSVSLDIILDSFNLANEFFFKTQYMWKALPLIATFAYTVKKLLYEKSNKPGDSDKPS
jgi:hypothetical protein